MSQGKVKRAIGETRSARPLRFLARVGFAVSGIVHVLIGGLILSIAVGGGNGQADQSGAMGLIARSPGGPLVLWIVSIGLAALGLWVMLGAFFRTGGGRKERVAHFIVEFGKGLAYVLLSVTAFTFALGGSTSSDSVTRSMSSALLAAPGGVLLLLLAAGVVMAVGIYFMVKGARRRFTRDIAVPVAPAARKAVIALGVIGYVAKGIALLIVGILLAIAAFKVDPSKASGLDGAIRSLVVVPFGQLILIVIGLGFVAYGVYSLLRARLARL